MFRMWDAKRLHSLAIATSYRVDRCDEQLFGCKLFADAVYFRTLITGSVTGRRGFAAYRRRVGGTGSRRGPGPGTTPRPRHSRRTPPRCSCPAEPRCPPSSPPDAQTTLFIHTRHTALHGAGHACNTQTDSALNRERGTPCSTLIGQVCYHYIRNVVHTLQSQIQASICMT